MKQGITLWLPKVIIAVTFFGLALLVGRDAVADNWQMFGLLAVGLLIGLFVPFFDRQWLSKYYRHDQKTPDDPDPLSSDTAKTEVDNLTFVTRTTFFLLILVPFSLFIVTSTGSPLGVGLTIGLVIDVVVDMVRMVSQKKEFIKTFLQQFQRSFSESEVMMVAGGAVIWLVLLFILALK